MAWSKKTRQARGYDEDWLRVRLQVLKRDNYLCHCPRCKGGELRLTPANEVDHIRPLAQGGDRLDMANLRAVNSACHRRLTLEQRGFEIKPRYNKQGRRIDE
jgi:5-methylcytosine-specific restriction protein A